MEGILLSSYFFYDSSLLLFPDLPLIAELQSIWSDYPSGSKYPYAGSRPHSIYDDVDQMQYVSYGYLLGKSQ